MRPGALPLLVSRPRGLMFFSLSGNQHLSEPCDGLGRVVYVSVSDVFDVCDRDVHDCDLDGLPEELTRTAQMPVTGVSGGH